MADSKSQHQIMLFLEKAHNLRQKTLSSLPVVGRFCLGRVIWTFSTMLRYINIIK